MINVFPKPTMHMKEKGYPYLPILQGGKVQQGKKCLTWGFRDKTSSKSYSEDR